VSRAARLPGHPLGRVSGDRAEEAVITDLAMLLDRLAELGSLPAIAALVSPAGPDHWPGFASRVRDVLYPLMSARGRQRADAELAAVTAATAAGGALVHTDLGGANLLWATAAGVPRSPGSWTGIMPASATRPATSPPSPSPSAGRSPPSSE